MRTVDAIWEIVKKYTDVVFYVPGGQAAFLVDALGWSGLRHISMLHEQGAAFAACGYAQQCNGLGVCLVTSGPGATNAITGCAAAWMDSLGVLFISGQANSWSLIGDSGLRVRGVQEVDIIPMVKPITKSAHRTMLSRYTIINLQIAIAACLDSRRGPAWLDVPLDIQAREV